MLSFLLQPPQSPADSEGEADTEAEAVASPTALVLAWAAAAAIQLAGANANGCEQPQPSEPAPPACVLSVLRLAVRAAALAAKSTGEEQEAGPTAATTGKKGCVAAFDGRGWW